MTTSLLSYQQQAEELSLCGGYEKEFSNKIKKLGRVLTIIGIVVIIFNFIFGYDLKKPLLVTFVSAIYWIGFHIFSQSLEQQVQQVIQYHRDQKLKNPQ